jgi:hypothetical protein
LTKIEPRPFADPEAAARKLMEIANSVEPVQDGRIHIELINWPMLHAISAQMGPAISVKRREVTQRSECKGLNRSELLPYQAS